MQYHSFFRCAQLRLINAAVHGRISRSVLPVVFLGHNDKIYTTELFKLYPL